MQENDKFQELISAIKQTVEGMNSGSWNSLAEQVTNDPNFKRADELRGVQDAVMVDNLPIALRHLLPNIEIDPEKAVEMAIALGSDSTIDQDSIRPLGALLLGNLARMRELAPHKS